MKKIYLLLALTMMMVQGAWAQGLSGSGTSSSDPYLIQNDNDWYTFATSVTNGTSYSKMYVKLTADINASGVMAGDTNSNVFRGTFDGDGHTITFNMGESIAPFAEDYCAPFRKIASATIKNLKTTGTIYTSQRYAAGIVAITYLGTNKLEQCHSNMRIVSTFEGDGMHGGLVARGAISGDTSFDHAMPNITEFHNCTFYGALEGANTTHWGGLMGVKEGSNHHQTNFYDCFFVPSTVNVNTNTENNRTFCYGNSDVRIENCYYTTQLGSAQGTQCYALYVMGLYTKLLAGNGQDYYSKVNISGVKDSYFYDGNAMDLGITLKSANNVVYELGTDYTFTIKRADDDATVTVADLTQEGSYTLTISAGNSGRCVGSSEHQFTVTAMATGSGTADVPFLINSEADWNKMAAIVAGGKSFSGKYVQLNADITVSTMVGTLGTQSLPFKGTFNGAGKKLTLSLGTAASPIAEEDVAPFRYINGATIQNLVIDGTVYTAGKYASCLVGKADEGCLVRNCKNVATLSSSVEGEGWHGSYFGYNKYSPTIEGCVFAGSLLGPNTDHVGGFSGYGYIRLVNCLFAPASITVKSEGSATFSCYEYNPFEDAFYTDSLGEAQCNPPYTISAASNGFSLDFGTPTDTYDVSGIEAYHKEFVVNYEGYDEPYTYDATYLLKYGGACYALADREISFTITNGAGLNHCSIAGDGGLIITPTSTGGQYTFTMPESSVTVYALGDNAQVTVGSHELSSFCSPYDLDFTQAEGVKAYVVSGFSPTTMSITLTQADYVPAGTGLVVTGAQGTYDVPIAATDKVWANLLVGAVAPTPITATDNGYSNFILGNGSEGWNWYEPSPGTLPAGKAYLRLPTRSVSNLNHARSFTWIFEDLNPTGIQEVQTADGQAADAWYTLDGVRMNGKPTSSGIYVRQGKKYVIK